MRILVVEDEPKAGEYLRQGLTESGFVVDWAGNGIDGLQLATTEQYDLILLDVMLPGIDGWQVVRELRKTRQTPVLFLTARDQLDERIKGLELGADDYLVKPFAFAELVARIRAILRRMEPPPVERERYQLGDIEIDIGARSVIGAGGAAVGLTAGEFDLLACFLSRPQRVLSREQLIEWTRGRDADPFDRTIDVQMSRLRRKLAEAGADDLFKTVRNAGYVLTRSTRL